MGANFSYNVTYRANVSEEVLTEKCEKLPIVDDFNLEYQDGTVWLRASFYNSHSFASDFEEEFYDLIRSTLAEGTVAKCYTAYEDEESAPEFLCREGEEDKAVAANVQYHKEKIEEHLMAIKTLEGA